MGFGGISPADTRSCTLTQSPKLSGFEGSKLSSVRSRRAAGEDELWQPAQFFRMNVSAPVKEGAAAALETVSKAVASRKQAYVPRDKCTHQLYSTDARVPR